MIDSTNPRIMADNIRALSDKEIAEAAEILALQGTVVAQGNAIEALGSYSTTEVNTGKKWIDDSPIYRKVIEKTVPNTTDGVVSEVNEAFSDLPISITGIVIVSTRRFPLGYENASGFSIKSYWSEADGIKLITNGSSYNGGSAKIIVEYIKAAPAPTPDLSPAPEDSRSIEPEEIPEDEYIEPEVREESPEEVIEEPVQEVKKTTRKNQQIKIGGNKNDIISDCNITE